MDKQAAIRRVRIAMSMFFGVLTLGLCVLWVRSYSTWRSTHGPVGKHVLNFQWAKGEIGIGYWDWKYKHFPWSFHSNIVDERIWPSATGGPPLSKLGIRWYKQLAPAMTLVVIPFWLPILIAVAIAATPWIRHFYHFSLRTMLIATTLVAVALGLIAWAGS
jgi:hypothetical protein